MRLAQPLTVIASFAQQPLPPHEPGYSPRSCSRGSSVQRFDFKDGSAVVAAYPEADWRRAVIDEDPPDVGRTRQQIIDHFAGFGVEPRHLVCDHRPGPRILVLVEHDIIRRCPARVEFPFLELFGLGIEHPDPVATVLAEPEAILCIHIAAARSRARCRRLEKRDFAGLCIYAPDLSLTEI